MSDDTRPRIEVTIAAPVEVVSDALRDKDKIRHWFGWDYDGLDGEIDLIFFTETVEDASARTLRLHGGDEFRLDLLGEDVTGEMWYRSDHQLGITVDAWGNGLLIVSSVDPAPNKPKGAAMAI